MDDGPAGGEVTSPLGPEIRAEPGTLVAMHQAAQERRSERRSYEWKITFTIWGALLLASKFAFETPGVRSLLSHGTWVWVASIAVAMCALVATYAWYMITLAHAMNSDRDYSVQLEKEAGVTAEAEQSGRWGFSTATRVLQVGVTLLLAGGVVVAALAAGSSEPCTTVTKRDAGGVEQESLTTCPSPA